MARLPSLICLGGASIEGPDGPLTGRAAQRHRLALLAVLAVEIRGTSRDKLAALLWPERPDAKARHALSDSVYRIGKALGEDALVSIGDREIRLDGALVPSDVGAFLEAISREDWEEAVAVYRGPFLDGFHLADAGEFERWAETQRARLARDYARALEALAERRLQEGDLRGAVAAWRLRAGTDPYDSRVAARLMEALADAGNPGAALRHGREHAELLRRELGAEPDPAIAATADRIRGDSGGEEAHARSEVGASPPTGPESFPVPSPMDAGGSPEPPEGPQFPHEAAPGRGSRRRRYAGWIAAVAVVLTGVWVAQSPEPGFDEASNVAVGPRALDADDPPPTIAVLPFQDLTPGSDRAWLGQSVAEEVRLALGRIEGLHVLGAISSWQFPEGAVLPREIAANLGADLLLGASVRAGGDSVWVTVKLVDGATGRQQWGETYGANASAAGMRSVQNRIAGRIAETLSLQIGTSSPTEAELPTSMAYDTYLEARFLLRRFQSGASTNDEELLTALGKFGEVVEQAPDWPDGWAGLGEAHHWVAYRRVGTDSHWLEAKRALAEALRLDPDHPRANASMGYVIHRLDRDYEAANAHFQKALEMDIGEYVHCGYALVLLWAGRYDEAVVATRRAEAHDPLYTTLAAFRATSARCADRPEDAVRHARRVLSGDPRVATARRDLALGLSRMGRTEEALGVLDEAVNGEAYYSLVRALILARGGRDAEAASILAQADLEGARRLTDVATSGQIKGPPVVAATFVALGRAQEALDFLRETMDRDPMVLLYDRCYPELKSLEGDPAYRDLLRRTGIPGA